MLSLLGEVSAAKWIWFLSLCLSWRSPDHVSSVNSWWSASSAPGPPAGKLGKFSRNRVAESFQAAVPRGKVGEFQGFQSKAWYEAFRPYFFELSRSVACEKENGHLKLNLYYHKYDIQKNSLCPNKSMLETDKFRFLITFKPLNNSIIITIVSCSRSFLSFRGFFNST